MLTKKPRESKKTPPSQMLRVPTPLIEAVQKLSRLHRLGHKNAVLHGLQSLISTIDSSSDIDFEASDEAIKQLALRLERLESRNSSDSNVDSVLKSVASLEQKLEAIQTRIAQMEGAIALLGQRQQTGPTRRQAFNYHPPQLELQPFNEENLAKRLAASASTIRNERETKSPKEFESWCRQRDPGGMGWRYKEEDFRAIANGLTPDDPAQPFNALVELTLHRWGRIPRTFIQTTQDQAILPATQVQMIADIDAFTPGNPTQVFSLNSSHSPFFSQPEALVNVLIGLVKETESA